MQAADARAADSDDPDAVASLSGTVCDRVSTTTPDPTARPAVVFPSPNRSNRLALTSSQSRPSSSALVLPIGASLSQDTVAVVQAMEGLLSHELDHTRRAIEQDSPFDSSSTLFNTDNSTMAPRKFSFDPSAFPHLFDRIISDLELQHLVSLRNACRFLRKYLEPFLVRHIVLVFDPATRKVHPSWPLERSPLDPTKNTWRAAPVTDAAKIIDLCERFVSSRMRRGTAYPTELATLTDVDMIRDFTGIVTLRRASPWPLTSPLPPTREWVAWIRVLCSSLWDPNFVNVSEHVVLNLGWGVEYHRDGGRPSRPVNVTIAFPGPWCCAKHGLQFEKHTRQCLLCSTTERCVVNPRQDPCTPGPSSAYQDPLLVNLATLIRRYIHRNPLINGEPALITLVNFDKFAETIIPHVSARNTKECFIGMVRFDFSRFADSFRPSRESISRHLLFRRLDKYRSIIGPEKFRLRHEVPSYCPIEVAGGYWRTY
ncbi:hypothetical protein CC85DRAFT_84999 [Cutaneotrichosporon oleaginosum]|uniref:Uncharacterized protein n=1 Tax=Cutaneotrichosporon oleaginosum TaxID=879819 RepID=A0A0J0XMU9_9TREE|nr:uncharacterized protein CC85DRAFT_84999 [Cutaneotrichosporon oleaginosum]KLT42426.1 hypothetical protein CC85DRAFT_84999 [Cutaneotrichosporon oleaginosum]TXT06945.1 hypothetical protein COLE_06276 [Cutaneotrichosporon oleaginosum]